MKTQIFRFILYSIIASLTCLNLTAASSPPSGENGVHFCGFTEHQSDTRRYARSLANLDVGEPRTVRMIYFLPNDRPYRADVVQRMKDEILSIQAFFAEQMGVHGYGKLTFRVETDPQGEPIVHRVDGEHPDSYYIDNPDPMLDQIERAFNLDVNIYLIVIDNSIERVAKGATGIGVSRGKSGGFALVNEEFSRDLPANLATHELGHVFGLGHDFRNGEYIMSYGPGWSRLSACHAELLSVHPYFNPDIPIEEGQSPTIEIISPLTYPAGSKSVSVQLKVSDSEGLHQVFLVGFDALSSGGLAACQGLAGEKDALVEFNYEGVITENGLRSFPHYVAHEIRVGAIDTEGNRSGEHFTLLEILPIYNAIATLKGGHAHGVNSVSFSPDGTTLAVGTSQGVKLWDMATHQIATLPHTAGVNSVSFSRDGTTLAAGTWQEVKLWDMATRQNTAIFEGQTHWVNSVSFSPDGATLASRLGDGTVKLWDVTARQNIVTLEGNTGEYGSVSFSPDGTTIAYGAADGTVKLWDVTTRQNIATLEGHTDVVKSVTFSLYGTTLASGSWDRTVKLWDVTTRQNIATLTGHTAGVISVSFSSDGITLASGSRDRTVKLWDVTTGVSFATLLHTTGVNSVSFSPDGATLAAGTIDGTVELWDTSELTQVRLEAIAEIVDIPDSNLRAAIATTFDKSPSALIVRRNMLALNKLVAYNLSISDLTGLELAINLMYLTLGENSVSDISALAGMSNLEVLKFWGNAVSDISAVAGLTNLEELSFWRNAVSDISAVAGLTNLEELSFWGNAVSDILAVAGLSNLEVLNFWGNAVSDISALAGLTNLEELNFWGNAVSDISAVAGLTKLTTLVLGVNFVSDISALAGLSNLEVLNFWGNAVSDISVLSGLTNLTWLGLGYNSISDISAVAGLTKLTTLTLGENFVSDISVVAGLTKLTLLQLSDNSISDISAVSNLTQLVELDLNDNSVSDLLPLVANLGLGEGCRVFLKRNPLNYPSIYTHIPTLKSRGVEITFDNRTPTSPLKITGDQQGTPGAALTKPFVVEVRDANGSAFEGVPVTFTITAGGGTLSVTSTTTDENGRAKSTLTLGPNLETNSVSVSAAEIEKTVTFTAVARERVIIPDSNLLAAVASTLGKASDAPITPRELVNLTRLVAKNANIGDLTGLDHATNLTWLNLGGEWVESSWQNSNSVSDLSPLTGLTKLTGLTLNNNSISDISVLSGLTNLTSLNLSHNSVSDISVLSGLTNLTFLNLWGNNITDISPLVANTGMGSGDEVYIPGNPLSYSSIYTHIPVLQERGVEVFFDDQAHPALLKISGDNQVTAPGTAVANPFVVEALDENGSVIEGISVTFTVTAGGGTLSVTNTTTDENGRAESTLTLGPNPGTNTVTVSAAGIPEGQTFNAVDIRVPKTLEIISGDDQEGLPGAALDKPFVVEVRDRADTPVPGVEVTFSVTGGGGTLSVTSATTDKNGRAESILILGSNAGTNTVAASVTGIQGEQTFSAEGIRIPETLDIISGNDQEGAPGAALENPFVVEVRDRADTPVPGVEVTFSVTGGGGTLSVTSATTDKNGRAESILILGSNAGTNTVAASVTGIQGEQTFSAEGIRIPETLDIISGNDQEGAPGAALENPFAVEVRDQFDKPFPDAEVTFTVTRGGGTLSVTSVTTDGNGRAESILILGSNAGTNTVTVSVAGIQEKETFNAEGVRIPLAFWIISGDKQQGLLGEALANPFVVEVRDQSGDPLLGVQVAFSVSIGGGMLSATSVTTDVNGRAESILTLGPNPGANTVEVGVTGIQEGQTFNAVDIRVPKTLEIISGNDQEGLPGAALENPFAVEVRDGTDKPLPGVEATFSVTGGGGTLSVTSATTDKNGRAESILILGSNAGTNTVTVSVTGSQEKAMFNAEGIRIPETLEIFSGGDQEGAPGAALENPFVVEVRDQTDKPLPGVQVTFSVTSGGGTLSATSATTDVNGRAKSILTLGPNPGTNTVTVSVTGTQQTETFNAEGVRIPTTLEIISGGDQEGLPGEVLEKPFVVEVRDQADTPVPGVQVTFTVARGGGTLSATSVTTNSNGRAESTLTLGPNPGTNTVTVSVAGIPEGQTFNAVDIRVPKTLEIISGNDQEGLPGAALDKPFVVEVRDRADTPVPGVEVTLSVTGGGGTLSVTSATTDKNGRAESILILGSNAGTNTVTVSVAWSQEEKTFSAEGIRIRDPNLRAAIATTLGKPPSAPFVRAHIPALTELYAPEANISDLTGLESATNLTSLTLHSNNISDISAVAGLTNLTSLTLYNNNISDISVVAGLTNLTFLSLWDNNISDISAVAGLTNLKTLELGDNNISNISVVAGLTNLTYLNLWGNNTSDISVVAGLTKLASLYLGGNNISDISVVAGLTNLTRLYLGDNNITDISPLVENTGLGSGHEVDIVGNPLSYSSIYTHIPVLQERGVEVFFDNRTPQRIRIVSGNDQQGLPGAALEKPLIVEVQDERGDAFEEVPITFTVTNGGGTLSVTSATTDVNGRAESILTLGPNPGANTVEVGVTGIQEKQSVSAIAELPPIPQDVNGDDVVNILDLVLVASVLGDGGRDLDADVNGDGVVNILDLVSVAGALGDVAAAPSANARALAMLTATDVGQWLVQAGEQDLTDATSREGVLFLEQLFAALTPKETALLPNFPNPFNPETWMPYQLAEDWNVTLIIRSLDGQPVRRLKLGHQTAGTYYSRSRAAYWDGKNKFGEQVASGVYFYTLTAGDYSATRKMLIIK